MDSVEMDRDIIERVLCECARFYAIKGVRTVTIFDHQHGQYVLLNEGWEGFKRLHYAWVHVELRDGKFWIQQDGTQDGIALELLAAGIPKDRIVLAFHHPSRWKDTEFSAG